MTTRTVLFRVDASPQIGMGHLVRSATLARALRDAGFQPWFVTAESHAAAWLSAHDLDYERVALEQASPGNAEDATLVVKHAAARSACAVVVDGYRFDASFVASVGRGPWQTLVVDDLALPDRLECSVVLNHNLYAEEVTYDTDGEVLLGPRYALLRPEILRARRRGDHPDEQQTPARRNVLVMMGGSDIAKQTNRVVRALATIDRIEVRAIVGPLAESTADLTGVAPPLLATIVRNPSDVGAELAWADLVVLAAGVVCLEAACVGVPMVLIDVADNQRRVSATAEARGIARRVGWYADVADDDIRDAVLSLLADNNARAAMVAKQLAIVDGRGAARVAESLTARVNLTSGAT